MRVSVAKIAETYAHVMQYGAGDGDGKRDAEDGMRQAQGIEVAIAKKDEAGGDAPDQGDRREDGIGQMREREEGGSCERGGGGCWEHARHAGKEETLHEELLDEGPQRIGPIGLKKQDHGWGQAARAGESRGGRHGKVQRMVASG